MGRPRRMAEPIDISVPLHARMTTWPNSTGFRLARAKSFESGDQVNVTRLDMDVHTGTHLEAPLHMIDGGTPLESMALDIFVGSAFIADLGGVDAIGPAELESARVPRTVERLLLKTRNSASWASTSEQLQPDYVALTIDGARWVAERRLRLVGIDYLSIQQFGADNETHRVLMRAGVAILEGIDLSGVEPGGYRLTCLPLRLVGTEAAPARAILEPLA